MVLAAADRVVGLDRCEEVSWDEFGALVDELVEGVLAVGACCTPDDGLCVVWQLSCWSDLA